MNFRVSLTTAVLHSDARKQHGTSDPFVKFMVGNKQVYRTRTVVTSLPLNTALTTSLPLSQAQPPPQVLLSLNLLQIPAEDSPSVHHSSHGRRNYGVLSLGLVEGRNFGDKMGDLEVHCKFRLDY